MDKNRKERPYPPPRIRVGPGGSISIVDVDEYVRSKAVQDDIKEMMKVDFTSPRKKRDGS